ncbi:hypothetical protein MF614_07050 [Escherichia coli]|uniref:hypothetical protein n=1 Tax=Escherichia coli TaxID=562 RepID=UPI001EF617E1|nr:hypothetical protein [Escherichia coli]ULH65969.1 hypothetical protein MF614_07050 [Escherichia coli]
MSTITREWLQQAINDYESVRDELPFGLDDYQGNILSALRIALASLEAEPVAWLHSDNGLGIPAITRSKNVADSWLSKGWYVQPLYIANPVPVVPDARPSLNNGIVGFDEGWNACRATMLHGAKPVSQTYKLNKLSGNSPVTPDGWVMVPKELTPEMMRAVQIRSELGGYATSNLSGAYNMFSEFWNVAVSAAPKVDDL